MKIAIIEGGIVVNIAIWDGQSAWNPGNFTYVDVTDVPNVCIGASYDGESFSGVYCQAISWQPKESDGGPIDVIDGNP